MTHIVLSESQDAISINWNYPSFTQATIKPLENGIVEIEINYDDCHRIKGTMTPRHLPPLIEDEERLFESFVWDGDFVFTEIDKGRLTVKTTDYQILSFSDPISAFMSMCRRGTDWYADSA